MDAMSTPSSFLLFCLVSTTTACFLDNMPADLSTMASMSGEGSTSSVTAASMGATDQGATSGMETGSTGGAGTTGTTGTAGTTDTSDPATTTAGGTSTGTAGDSECSVSDGQFECVDCCRDMEPGAGVYFVDLEQCVCEDGQPCAAECKESVCGGDWLDNVCFACIAPRLGEPCFQQVRDKCAQQPACALYLDCLDNAACARKPAAPRHDEDVPSASGCRLPPEFMPC